MLQQLSVRNYALIDHLQLGLSGGFSAITGETGAGKSIILGALGLVLGNRADLKALRDTSKKCVVEAHFLLDKDSYVHFFEENDLDFEKPCILRREITPSGKSRAFINDTPVTLNLLQELSSSIIDVHSQHDTLLLNSNSYQLNLLDSFAENEKEVSDYKVAYARWKSLQNELQEFDQSIDFENTDIDYLKFLYNELSEAKLEPGEQENIESELGILENSEEIGQQLQEAIGAIESGGDQAGILDHLRVLQSAFQHLGRYQQEYQNFLNRGESIRIEIDDIRQECEERLAQIDNDPARLEQLDARLSHLLHLQKKHALNSDKELIQKRDELEKRLKALESFEERRMELEQDMLASRDELRKKGEVLSLSRKQSTAGVEEMINGLLSELKMPGASFHIQISQQEEFTNAGFDRIEFYFSANRGQSPQPLKKVASGGEMSRVMLALKSIMAEKNRLPSIIFDEIDTGVSGETAGKIGQILRTMGKKMQVLAITHLPQIASLGETHFKVNKKSDQQTTTTEIRKLEEQERLNELARLLSGEQISEAALANARNLLAQH